VLLMLVLFKEAEAAEESKQGVCSIYYSDTDYLVTYISL
jgi:hypothetical protein